MSGENDRVKWRGIQPVDGIRGMWPARNATRVNESGYQAGVGTLIIYTVPANKLLFMTSMFLCSRITVVANTAIKGFIRDEGDVETFRFINHYFAGKDEQTSGMQYIPAVEAQAGYDICVSCEHANAGARLILSGWLEDQ